MNSPKVSTPSSLLDSRSYWPLSNTTPGSFKLNIVANLDEYDLLCEDLDALISVTNDGDSTIVPHPVPDLAAPLMEYSSDGSAIDWIWLTFKHRFNTCRLLNRRSEDIFSNDDDYCLQKMSEKTASSNLLAIVPHPAVYRLENQFFGDDYLFSNYNWKV